MLKQRRCACCFRAGEAERELSEKIVVDNYLNTNHWVDAVASLETAQKFCSRVTLDEASWKWASIAVHSGVQGFMVLALEHGNALLVMKHDIAARWLKAHNAGAPYPEEKMDR